MKEQLIAAVLSAATVSAGVQALPTGTPAQVEGIPNRALVAYVSAAKASSCGVRWYDLAAVGVVESGHGTHGGAHIQDDGTISKPIGSSAGAQGPMQFMPETWQQYRSLGVTDGDGDGAENINDVDDAARASAEYLCRNGYVAGDRAAVENAWGAYNGGAGWPRWAESRQYVVDAQRFADAYSGADVSGVQTPAGVLEGGSTGGYQPPPERTVGNLLNATVTGVVDATCKATSGAVWAQDACRTVNKAMSGQ